MSEGVVIDQRFRLGRVIRESGVAVVYEAKHRNGADAWIKLPRTPEHGGALLAEARVANALGKNAVNLRDDGVTEDGLPYLVLEPVTGQRLDHWRESNGGRAPPDEAMGLGDELCQAIGTMHAAGFAVGLLRADAILVLPKGGMCLLELEHARPSSEVTIKEDVVRVGRVLYEMLSGMPCIATAKPLHEAAPELPRAMTSTVDDAARGRYATIDELRSALRASMPDWLGPRKPMPSIVPDVSPSSRPTVPASTDFEGIVLPRPSRPLFDPRDLVDSSRNISVAAEVADARGATPNRPSIGSRPSLPSRPSDVSPVAAFSQIQPEPPPKRKRSIGLVIAGAAASLLLLATTVGVIVVFASKEPEADVPAPVAKAASSAVMIAAAPSAAPALTATHAPAASAPASDEVIEVDDVAMKPPAGSASVAAAPAAPALAASAPAESASAAAAAPAAASAPAGDTPPDETSFRFEGDLSPRLVIVDGIMMGTTTKPVRTKCGTHVVKIGGKGAERSVDLPCGGEQTIVIETNGKWRAE